MDLDYDWGLWTVDSRLPNLTNARYRTLHEEAREKGEGRSFIDTAGLFYAIGNYAMNDVEANNVRAITQTQSNTKRNSTCRHQCHHSPGASDIVNLVILVITRLGRVI